MTVAELLGHTIVQALIVAALANFAALVAMVFRKFPLIDFRLETLTDSLIELRAELRRMELKIDDLPTRGALGSLTERVRGLEVLRMSNDA